MTGTPEVPILREAAGRPRTEWRRLDKRMLLIHPLQTLVRALPALLALFVARLGSDGSDRWDLLALPLIVAFGLLRWATTRYRIADGQIELRRGLFNKQTTTARLDKVRTVDLTAQLHHRALGLAKVEISTGSAAKDRLELDALSVQEGRRLRAELLHRVDPHLASLPAPTGEAVDPGDRAVPEDLDEELLRLHPSWVRYAPFTMTGIASAAAILGFLSQGLARFTNEGDALESGARLVRELEWWVDGLVLLVAVSLLAIGAYVLSFWGFRLTRNGLGSLHTRRGLLTTRETSIDHGRVRGVRLGQPLGLRLAGASRLKVVSTGLHRERGGGSDWLAPPAPVPVVARLAAEVVGDDSAVNGPLVPHGPAARRRRLTRAVLPAVVVLGAVVVARQLWDWSLVTVALAALLVAAAVPLARDRYAGLGHRLTDRHLVARHGSFDRARVILDRDGVIGWKVEQSFFQRRAGVATLVATTAAGAQRYDLLDVTPDRAYGVIGDVSPDLLAQFR